VLFVRADCILFLFAILKPNLLLVLALLTRHSGFGFNRSSILFFRRTSSGS
jgi:hypothetical protein